EALALAKNARDDRLPRSRRQMQVDEARAGDLHALDPGRGVERGDDGSGELPRLALERFGELQGSVGRVVAVARLLRPFEHDRSRYPRGRDSGQAAEEPIDELGAEVCHKKRYETRGAAIRQSCEL